MSTPAGGLVGEGHINVNANTDPARRALNDLSRHADGRLRDMRGRFTSESRLIGTAFNRAAGGGGAFNGALEKLKGAALSLAPALIPIAAQAAPIAAGLGAATVAVGAFAAAAGGQVAAITEASEAEKKYKDAVAEHGAASKQASDASAAYARQMAQMPPATREAAVALSGLKNEYREWSDGLASSTMPVATKAIQTFGAIFPKLTPMVQGAGTQLDRFVTIVAGGVQSSAFDSFMRTFSEFSTSALQRGNEHLIRFMRTLNTGKVSGGFSTFMDYVRDNGPIVREMLSSVMQALGNMAQAAANVGPGLLTVVNVIAKLVATLPPDVITHMLQLALALKAVRLAAAGAAAMAGGLTAFTASITAMQLAAGGATGVLPRLGAAIATLSRTAKVAIAGTGIGLLLIALTELSQRGRAAPPDVDKLTTSLARLGATGKVTGEAAKGFGADLDGLHGKVKALTDPSTTDKVQQFLVGWTGWDSTPVKEAKEWFDGTDKSLADLVKNGHADQAAAAVKRLTAEYGAGGRNTKEFTGRLDEYKGALADAKYEQQLAVQAMGIFGQQAQDTSAKLAAQKGAADGLRAAITALNEVNQSAYGAQIQFEAAIDSLTASFKEHGATLNVDTAAGQANGQAMLAAAKSQDELVAAGLAAGNSLESMTGKSNKLRAEMMRLATEAFDGNKKKAQEYTNTLLGTPESITTHIKAERAEAITGLQAVQREIQKTPGAKTVRVSTLNAAAIKALEAVGLKTRQLPDGRTEVYTANGQAIGSIGAVTRAMNNLNGKVARTYTFHEVKTNYVNTLSQRGQSVHDAVGATGGLFTGKDFKHRGYASGGLVDGPGTETSDDVYAPWLSKNEFVVNARRTRQYLPLLKAINSGGMSAGGMAGGGMASAGMDAGRGLASGLSGAAALVLGAAKAMAAVVETGVRQELRISSPSKVMQALAKDIGAGLVKGLTGTREQISRTAADLANSIITAFRGRKTRIDDQFVAGVAYANKRLQVLAAERDRIAQRIADAKKFSADVAAQAKGAFSLQSITQGPAGVSGETIRRGLAAAAGQIREFIGRINVLRKKGLSKDLLAQIIGMGPEAGLEFANVLSRQSDESLREINRLQGQINKASTDLGKLSADALFDAGKESGRGFLAGLAGQRKQIEQLMLSIAKSMQQAIRKALGIKSPSTVMAEVGRQSTLGVAVGLADRLPAVKKAMSGISRTISTGIAAPGLPASAPAGGRGGRVAVQESLNVTFINHGPIGSQREMDDWLVGSMDRLRLQRRLPKGA